MGNGNINYCHEENEVRTLIWDRASLKLIDQRKLPFKEEYVVCNTCREVADAISDMVVRGAPAIGVTAGYGVALASLEFNGDGRDKFISYIKDSIKVLSKTRPTAVNLFWALGRMEKVLDCSKNLKLDKVKINLAKEAEKIERQDLNINFKIGENGKKIFDRYKNKIKILTHCNAGALATSGYGTAIGVIRSLDREGKIEKVIVDETRPCLQGARLTSWELYKEKIPFHIITDNMAGYFMSKGEIDTVIVGADRVSLNGDTANKIGTLGLSIMAKYYSIPFYIAAPISTIDTSIESGKYIPIEQRGENEVREVMGTKIIPEYMPVKNPAFDVTPCGNITAIITEKGVIEPPFKENIKKIVTSADNTDKETGADKR